MSCPQLNLQVRDADDEYYTVNLCYWNPWVAGNRPDVTVNIKQGRRKEGKGSLDFDNPVEEMGFTLPYEDIVVLIGFLQATRSLIETQYPEYLAEEKADTKP